MKSKIQVILCLFMLQFFALEVYGQGFKLPWNSGVSHYVSRTGSPAPTGSTGSSCGPNSVYNYTAHGYVAIDFDTPNNVYDAVRAVKVGVVIFAGWNGRYGNLVRVRHSDGVPSECRTRTRLPYPPFHPAKITTPALTARTAS